MTVSEEMVDAAIRKATEAGLLPRRCSSADQLQHRILMRDILEAAMAESLAAIDRSVARRGSRRVSG